jgi:hypothetical protein
MFPNLMTETTGFFEISVHLCDDGDSRVFEVAVH